MALEISTQKTIKQIKEEYCKKLKGKVSELSETEVTNDGAIMLYEKKRCAFVKTEKNYLLVRNLELKVGVQLIQASAELKKNVTAYMTQNDALVEALRAVVKTAKEAKSKFGELKEAADKLDGCRKDSCNAVQIKILGCGADDCNDNNKREDQDQKPDACKNVCAVLDDLVSIPESLRQDIDIIFNSATEIVGIQSFSNIKTLDKFQQDLGSNAKEFDDLIQLQITNGGSSLKKAQEDLVAQIKSTTLSGYALYNKRNELQTVEETKNHLCNHECNCIGGSCKDDDQDDNQDNRLKKCKCDICDICEEVTEIYSVDKPQNDTTAD